MAVAPVQYGFKPTTTLTFYALQKQSHCALGFGISWVNVATQKEWRHQFAQGKGTVYSWSGLEIISITSSPRHTPPLSTAVPHPPKPASCFECPIKTQLMLLGCDPQTLPGISMNSAGSFPWPETQHLYYCQVKCYVSGSIQFPQSDSYFVCIVVLCLPPWRR